MSPVTDETPLPDNRFPRVSGDEPVPRALRWCA